MAEIREFYDENQIGALYAAANVDTSQKKRRTRAFIDDSKIEKMKELREKGLSNKQISIEMGLCYRTVLHYLGPEADMLRSKYGSIVSHTTGESFVCENKIVKQQPPKTLKLVKTTTVFDGETLGYKVTSEGQIRISNSLGESFMIEKEGLPRLISELCELQDWLMNKESKESSVVFGLDGKVRSM